MESQIHQMNNLELWNLFQTCGAYARKWKQRVLTLLPEIYKRRMYREHGFTDIFECAAKIAGIGREQVMMVLRTEERLSDKPELKQLFDSGKASVHVLSRLSTIATKENQHQLAQHAQKLPKREIETLIRDQKRLADQQIEQLRSGKEITRYIPIEIIQSVVQLYGTKCIIPTCDKNAAIIHHAIPFSVIGMHDPRFLVPLCASHHTLVHLVDLKVDEHRTAALIKKSTFDSCFLRTVFSI